MREKPNYYGYRAWLAGYHAAIAGADTSACPYRTDRESGKAWFDGYRCARQRGMAKRKA